jgi:antitoxin YefM
MNVISATQARSNLYNLIDEAAVAHKPILITGKRNNAVLVSEEDWNAIQETLFLVSIPGMRSSILEGGLEPVAECTLLEDIDW